MGGGGWLLLLMMGGGAGTPLRFTASLYFLDAVAARYVFLLLNFLRVSGS